MFSFSLSLSCSLSLSLSLSLSHTLSLSLSLALLLSRSRSRSRSLSLARSLSFSLYPHAHTCMKHANERGFLRFEDSCAERAGCCVRHPPAARPCGWPRTGLLKVSFKQEIDPRGCGLSQDSHILSICGYIFRCLCRDMWTSKRGNQTAAEIGIAKDRHDPICRNLARSCSARVASPVSDCAPGTPSAQKELLQCYQKKIGL